MVWNMKILDFYGGSIVSEFEKRFSEYIGVKYGVATNSGTSSLHTILRVLQEMKKVGKRDAIIVPTYSFVSTLSIVKEENMPVIFVDVDETFSIDPNLLETALENSDKKIGALLMAHLYGNTSNMDTIQKIVEDYGLLLIEDACQAHGAEWAGRKLGSYGLASAFSFSASKPLTTGEGGMILTNNPDIHNWARIIRQNGKESWDKYVCLGYNYRMTDLQAILGLHNLDKLDIIIDHNRAVAELYYNTLKNLEKKGKLKLMKVLPKCNPSWYKFPVGVEGDRYKIVSILREINKNVEIGYNVPLHKMPFLQQEEDHHPESEWLAEHLINLPTSVKLKTAKLIAEKLVEILEVQ